MPPVVDWVKIREEFETTDVLLKDLAAMHGLKEGTIRSRKNREGWSRVATLEDNATQRDTEICNVASDVATQETVHEPEPFPGQCEAIGHKTGKRCRRKVVSGELYCSYHLDGHRENQCTARSRQSGERCKNAAEPGKKVCKFHGGKSTGSVGYQNNLKHGFFAKIFPDDEETRAIVHEIMEKGPLDILWEQIIIQYTAIARAQKIMFVRDQEDITKHLKREKSSVSTDEAEWEFQYAWDKQANFLKAQSTAMKTLDGLISRYEELVEKYEVKGYVVEEHRLRVEKLKAEITKITTNEDDKPIEIIIKRKGGGNAD
ncbi:phage terminase small subunit [Desulforamulus aquiferis]|uniref:Phage terminase small subunit n=1 Tax=Desulforamulus aquiferis TaxID=1397668 RepID=A0AAW7ZDA6_9FIRM|nr:phage terminase small subunit [Desulforamulus aquiferis]MDO7787139.1 phage terminase small subunit [Desulforamulus aquiferis]